MRDAEKDLHMCGVDSGDSFIFNIVLPYWITRAQQLEARVMELEQILLDASKLVRTRLCDHCEDHRAEGNCPQDEVDECWEYQLFKRIDDIL
jgi:hypothetical protein